MRTAKLNDVLNLVPAESGRILDTYGVADSQPGKWAGVLIVLSLDLVSTGGSSAAAILGAFLPLFAEDCMVGRDTRAKRLTM